MITLTHQLHWFLLTPLLFASSVAEATIPSGAKASLAALRQAYIAAVNLRDTSALERLFDMSPLPPKYHAELLEWLKGNLGKKISSVVIADPDTKLRDEFARGHAHFPYPVIKTFTINFVIAYPEKLDSCQYYIGTSGGKYFFVTASPEEIGN